MRAGQATARRRTPRSRWCCPRTAGASPGRGRPGRLTPRVHHVRERHTRRRRTAHTVSLSSATPARAPCPGGGRGCGLAGPDGVFDWAVGERRSTSQAIAYTTVRQIPAPSGDTVDSSQTPPRPRDPGADQAAFANSQLFALDTWALNTLDVI